MLKDYMNRIVTSVNNRGGRVYEAAVEIDGLSHDRIMTSVPEGRDPEDYICERFGLEKPPAPEPIE